MVLVKLYNNHLYKYTKKKARDFTLGVNHTFVAKTSPQDGPREPKKRKWRGRCNQPLQFFPVVSDITVISLKGCGVLTYEEKFLVEAGLPGVPVFNYD